MDDTAYLAILNRELGPKRVAHCQRVAETAVALAHKNHANERSAYIAGLMHDYAKKFDSRRLLEIASEADLVTDPCELKVPSLLHGAVGAYLLKKENIVQDEAALQAMVRHTVGCAHMSLLDKVIYVADYIEPGRTTPGVESVRKAAFKDLDQGVWLSLTHSLTWLLGEKQIIHPQSIQMYNWLLSEVVTVPRA